MKTNRFISNADTFDKRLLNDIKFGGAIITGYNPESVGGISTKAIMDRCPVSVEDCEADTYVDMFVATRDRFGEGTRLHLHLQNIPNVIGLLQKTYDDFNTINTKVVKAL